MDDVLLLLIAVTALFISYVDVVSREIWDYQLFVLTLLVFFLQYYQAATWDFFSGSLIALLFNGIIYCAVYWYYGTEQYGMGDVLLHLCAGGFLGLDSYINFFVFFTIGMGLITGAIMFFTEDTDFSLGDHSLPLAPYIFAGVSLYEGFGRPSLF